MNKRIAKKIEDLYTRDGNRDPFARYWTAYTPAQRAQAEAIGDRMRKRKAAAVRAKRGWSQPVSHPNASWLPNPYSA